MLFFSAAIVSACGKTQDCGKEAVPPTARPLEYVHRGANALYNIANNSSSITATPHTLTTSGTTCTSNDSGTSAAITAIVADISSIPAKIDCTKPAQEVMVGSNVDHYYAVSLIGTTNSAQTGSGIYFPAMGSNSAQVLYEFPTN
jgi:hypothetical protein